MTVSHLHERTLVHPDKADAFMLEDEPVRTEDAREIGRSGFRPFRIMIPRDDIVRNRQTIQDLLRESQLLE